MKKHIAALIIAMTASHAAFAEIISLDRLNSYINGLPVVKGNFTQINPDGSRSKGELYINRPGKMRFEYAPPNNALVIANEGSIAVYDDKSNNGPTLYPLKRTPLNLILANQVDLKTNGMIVKHIESEEYTILIARDPKHETQGQIQLVFTDNPIALRQWIITDQSRRKTTVLLSKLKEQKKLPKRLFEIETKKDERN